MHWFVVVERVHPPDQRCRCGQATWAEAVAHWRTPEGAKLAAMRQVQYCR